MESSQSLQTHKKKQFGAFGHRTHKVAGAGWPTEKRELDPVVHSFNKIFLNRLQNT